MTQSFLSLANYGSKIKYKCQSNKYKMKINIDVVFLMLFESNLNKICRIFPSGRSRWEIYGSKYLKSFAIPQGAKVAPENDFAMVAGNGKTGCAGKRKRVRQRPRKSRSKHQEMRG